MSSSEEEFDERHGFWGEDGQWYERHDNQHTKEDHIYGIFASNTSKHQRSYNPRTNKKYQTNKPIIDPHTSNLNFNFIKGGVQTVQNTDDAPTNTDKTTEDNPHKILKEYESILSQKRELNASRNGPQLGKHGLPQKLGKTHKTNHANTHSKPIINIKRDQGYGAWTKTEKRAKFGGLSFAEKYLKKHGFKGRLGVNAQGIANPIKQAFKRRNNEGLGFNDCDTQQTQPKNVTQELKEIQKRTEKERQIVTEQQKLWKIIDENTEANKTVHFQPKKKRKISYETASDYLKKNESAKMEIYDYTRGDVIITTTDQLSSDTITNEICPAFKHNLDRICDLISERKIVLDRERQCLEQKKYEIKCQMNAYAKVESVDRERNKGLYELKALIAGLNGSGIDSDGMFDIFETIQRKFYVKYLKYKLWKLYESVVFPRIKMELQPWNCDRLIQICEKWRVLLCNDSLGSKRQRKRKKDCYDLLIENVIIPMIRTRLYEWHPLDSDINCVFVTLFKRLKTVFPKESYTNLVNILIIPRLNHIFKESDCDLSDEKVRECIIAWDFIFGMDGNDMILSENIFKTFKTFWRGFNGKMESEHILYFSVLQKWECVLLGMGRYDMILDTFVVPKLENILTECVRKLKRNKAMECIKRFNFVHLWYENSVFNTEMYVSLIRNGFLNEWLFLVYNKCKDFEESMSVNEIALVWDQLFAVINNDIFGKEQTQKIRDLLECEVIEKYMNTCLDMINLVISEEINILLPSFAIIENVLKESLMSKKEKKRLRKQNKKAKKKLKKKEIIVIDDNSNKWMDEYKNEKNNKSVTLIELIEAKAQNLGIEFYLDFNKQFEGKKVYKFGTIYIYFYDKLIFAKQVDQWKPVDFNDLTRMCS